MPTTTDHPSLHPIQKVSCHHERHMSGIVLKVYNLFYRMAKQSPDGSISLSNPLIARLINGGGQDGKRPGNYISRVKTTLVRAGLFISLGKRKNKQTGAWLGGRYVPVSHKEWAEIYTKKVGRSPCSPIPIFITVEKHLPPCTRRGTQSRDQRSVGPCAPAGTHTVHTQEYAPVRTPNCAQSVDSFQGAAAPRRREEQASRSNGESPLNENGRGFSPSKPSPESKKSLGDLVRQRSWELLEIDPCSVSKEFRHLWEWHASAALGDRITGVIRQALETARQRKIQVPKEFLIAKQRLEVGGSKLRL